MASGRSWSLEHVSTAGPGPTDEAVLAVGRAVVDALQRRNFRQVCTLFGPALLEALPPKALETVWEATEQRFGILGLAMSTKVVRADRITTVTRATFDKGFADIVVTFGDDGDVAGLSVLPAPGPGSLGEAEAATLAATSRRITKAIPLLLGLVGLLALGALATGEHIVMKVVWWGGTGWTFGMLSRAPLSAWFSRRYAPVRAARAVQISAGVVEELLRIGVVAWKATNFADAVSVAFGWAAVELIYGALSSFVSIRLASGTGDRAELARMQLMLHGQQPHSGTAVEIAERAVGALYQAGAVLLLSAAPIFGFMLLPIRGFLEGAPGTIGLQKARIARAAAALFLVVAGLTAHGKL